MQPLTLNTPYPTTEGITTDYCALRIISPAYATNVGELNAVLQYVYHSFFFKKHSFDDIADTLVSIAVAEMKHLNILGGMMLSLGGAPVYSQYPPEGFNFYSAKYVAYSSNLKHMLEDDLLGEKRATRGYERMIAQLKNGQVKAVIERILQDEYLHIEKLTQILQDFKC